MAAKYIFGGSQTNGMVSKLSGTTKNLTAGLMSDPQKIENVISMVRTVAPLTSQQTVSKVNTYLPLFEKVSTLFGMYSFLNRAQTFKPIETLNIKSPMDMMSAFMKNGNMPINKLAQPLIASNMEKMMGNMAMNMFKNGNMNDILKNANIGDMLSAFAPNSNNSNNSSPNNMDIGSLMETFMPLINSMSNNSNDNDDSDENDYNYEGHHENYNEPYEKYDEDVSYDNYDHPPIISPQEEVVNREHEDNSENYNFESHSEYGNQTQKYEKNNNNDKPSNFSDERNNIANKDIQKPIRIKQRRRR